MDLSLKNLELADFFTDPLLLNNICQYLSIPQQLRLSICNKKLRFIMQNFCRIILQQNKLSIIPGKEPIHQMRFYFDRCLRIFKEQKQQKEFKSKKQKQFLNKNQDQKYSQLAYHAILKTTIENPFKFQVITFFEVGKTFSCCLNIKKKACIFRTKELISMHEHEKKVNFIERHDILDIKCKGQKLLYLKNKGEVYICSVDKHSPQIIDKQILIQWTISIPICKLYASYNYAILIPQNPNIPKNAFLKHIFNYETDPLLIKDQQQYENHEERNILALNIINLNIFMMNIPSKIIHSIAVGHKEAYFITEKYQCMFVEFDNFNQGAKTLQIKTFLPLQEKSIVKVSSGYNFYYALERNLENIQDWDVEKTLAWLRKIGFGDFVQIARAEKLDGKKLANIQKKYLENVLGITKLNMRQKIMMCISQVKQGKSEITDQLYVWGKNEYGQLGVSHANYIAQPLKIKMNFLREKEQVDSIFCGWFETFVRTKKGRIYKTIAKVERKKKKYSQDKPVLIELENSDDDELQKDLEEYHKMKPLKKRKKTEDFREKEERKAKTTHKKFEEEQRWVESTVGKAFFVDAYKDFSFYVQCPDQNKFEPEKRKKLRTAKAVLDRILWGDSQVISEFKIGYIDKQMGIIETSAAELQSFEFKETRIKYIKKNNLVVWDRDNKFDHLL